MRRNTAESVKFPLQLVAGVAVAATVLAWLVASCIPEPGVGDDDSELGDDDSTTDDDDDSGVDDDDTSQDDDDSSAGDDDTIPDDDDAVSDDDDSATDCATPYLIHEVAISDILTDAGNYALHGTYTSTNPCGFSVEISGVSDDCLMMGCEVWAPDGTEVESAQMQDFACYDELSFVLGAGESLVEEGGSYVPAQPGTWQVSCRFFGYLLNGVSQDITIDIEYETESI